MDALSDVLQTVRLTGGVFLVGRFTAPFRFLSQVELHDCRPYLTKALQLVAYHHVVEGSILVSVEGGETIATENLTPEGTLAFQLPTERPRIGLDIGDGMEEPEVVLHTVMIHLDEGEIDLVWRGAVPYPGPEWLPEMKKTEIVVE